jgi:hypothetical protein
MTQVNWKRYALYLLRWQLSTPILAGVLFVLSRTDKVTATVIANLLGGLVFFWIDIIIFTSDSLSVQWEVRDTVRCVDCGKAARGYRIIRAKEYDKSRDGNPEFRCEKCSTKKTEELRLKGISV